MTFGLILPGVVAILLGVVAGLWNLPMRPRPTLRVLTTIAIVGAGTAFTLVAMLVAGFAARFEILQFAVRWCPVVPIHHEIGLLEGLRRNASDGSDALSNTRCAESSPLGRRWNTLAKDFEYLIPINRLRMQHLVARVAFVRLDRTPPGVESEERQVLFAHERAHLHQRHDRHLLVGALATAIMPPLGAACFAAAARNGTLR